MYKSLSLLLTLLFLLAACDSASTPAATEEQAQESQTSEAAASAETDEEAAARAETDEEAASSETEEEAASSEFASGGLTLATTTSTYDSGLLDAILPLFEEETGMDVEVVAVGTGQALALGEQGDADVLLVHARAREDAFMDAGHGTRREDVMYNDFVIVGPPNDPAGVSGMENAAETMAQIADSGATFVSRGDDSGTHTKEKSIWEAAGIEPSGDWYQSIGQGMGATLTFANEEQGYTLSDRATYLSRTLDDDAFELVIVSEGDPILFNPYGVMTVNPDKSDQINAEGANQFIDWLISVPTQEIIGEFGTETFGSPLFTPDSEAWNAAP